MDRELGTQNLQPTIYKQHVPDIGGIYQILEVYIRYWRILESVGLTLPLLITPIVVFDLFY